MQSNLHMNMGMHHHHHTNAHVAAAITSAMTPSPTASATLRRKKKTQPLPSAAAHELDVMRAARQGIDISGMAPEERCKYPSKFCCHKRARKTTGKLHRFCEYHRTRARLNQKRWTDIRRRHDRDHEMAQTRQLLSSFADWSASFDQQHERLAAAAAGANASGADAAADASMVRGVAGHSDLAIILPKNATTMKNNHQSDRRTVGVPSSPTGVDGSMRHAASPLTDEEIEQLVQLLQEEEPTSVGYPSHFTAAGNVSDAFDVAWFAGEWLDVAELTSMAASDAFDVMPVAV